MTAHRIKQREIIDIIEEKVRTHTLTSSTVSPVRDYERDSRICLTSVHFPHIHLIQKIQQELIAPLRDLAPDFYYYPPQSLHMTIKNVRLISDPPLFDEKDVQKTKSIFFAVIPKYRKFRVYFYRLLLFPNNLALMGTTDPELDHIILDLDKKLKQAGIPDDKVYVNPRYFFSNMTLVRFTHPPDEAFRKKAEELSGRIRFDPYLVDSVTLLSGNAVFKRRRIRGTWRLKTT